ncbi:MAG: hydrolase [Candidatus Methanoperedens nitroreducens]|uniref:Hydrolase n=1 Tax=Candidatus Methanoperedens nitratireducens TaxID=1392998 RepID=A0A0N8KRM4_9EURY|nr:alpha/beta hydrolase [Candidatus Methanoperedens sp. BLZ2]KAB2941002.1 MAG: alpha/beta hydrolase [Candidatus Methanoperedens sp.]KPQ45346.1 MAG: hydrolase [Candidatus Methanoperedens sp. BLZ1]MBZ0175728.1 alpha/beta hydrolase [Candidatus Methanoperedens nitroreducens]
MSKELKRFKEGEISFLKGGEGEPFLLLHGIPGSAFTWESAGMLLAEHYQVIIPDLLGFGQSDMPHDDYYIENQARGIKQLLDNLGINKLYLGSHDFGGPVSLTLMRLFPDLTLNGLVLSATNVFTDTPIPLPLRIAGVPFLNTIFFKAMVGNKIGIRMMYLAATKEKTDASWKKFERHLTPSGIDFTRRIFQRSLSDLKTNYQAIEDTLRDIAVRTLILWGETDPFFAISVGERIRRAIPGSTLKIYYNTGHFVPEEQPSYVARDIMDFFGWR